MLIRAFLLYRLRNESRYHFLIILVFLRFWSVYEQAADQHRLLSYTVIRNAMTNVSAERPFDEIFDNSWVKELKICFLVVVIFLTACANGLVIWAMKRFIALRKPANMYIGALAIADFCMVIPLALKIVQILTRNSQVCVSQGTTELIVVSCISLHLACIAVERFVSIKYCLRYDSIVSKRKIYVSIALMWLLSIVCALIIPIIIHADHFQNLADGLMTLCTPKKQQPLSELPERVLHYAQFMLIFFFAVPCVIILLSNSYIFIASSKQRRKILTQNTGASSSKTKWGTTSKRLLGDLKAARPLFFIQALFVATYFPYFAVTVVRIEHSQHNERLFYRVSKSLSFFTALTSLLNPVIYVSGNEHFRKAFRKLLRIRKKSVN